MRRAALLLAVLIPIQPIESPHPAPIPVAHLWTHSVAWDTRTATNGPHILTAVARDAAGNVTESAPIFVWVNNPGPQHRAPMRREP